MAGRSPQRRQRMRAAAFGLLLGIAGAAQAVVVEQMQVTRDGALYTIAAVMTIAAPPVAAYRAATDYERLPDFNPSIVSSERIGCDRLRSNLRLCVALICKNIQQLMHYEEYPPDRVEMRVVAGAGDFRSGHTEWRFRSDGARGTRLHFDAEMEPDFWIPPLVGPYLIARELRRQTRVTATAIEQLADDYVEDDG